MKTFFIVSSIVLLTLCAAGLWPKQANIDPESGLIIATGWKRVDAYCTGCHTAQMIIRQRATRDEWVTTVRRMQKIGQWTLRPSIEAEIVDYLSNNYPAKRPQQI